MKIFYQLLTSINFDKPNIFTVNPLPYSAKKKEVNGAKSAKYFFTVEKGKFFLTPLCYERELPYEYNFGKKNCLTIIGGNYLQIPGR